MKKALALAMIALLIILAGCGKQMTAKPLKTTTPSAPAAEPVQESPAVAEEETKTAAEALKELESGELGTAPAATGAKTGSTGMPPAPEGVTGEEALKARTRSLYSQGTGLSQPVEADRETGSISDDLPPEYGNDNSAGD